MLQTGKCSKLPPFKNYKKSKFGLSTKLDLKMANVIYSTKLDQLDIRANFVLSTKLDFVGLMLNLAYE